MLRDVAIFDIIVPAILVIFFVAIILQLAIDWWLGRIRFYHHVWHPPLFRFACFFTLFSLLSLWLLPL